MSLSPQWLDELRSRLTLSSIIGRTTKLNKAGREFRACCPFHNEKSPSFYVNDEKGFYHCFGCGAHGDVIRWMTDNRGLAFIDAVKELALQAGMELPALTPHVSAQAAQRTEQRTSLYDVMTAAQSWFVAMLASPEGAKARTYLATRGVSAEAAQRFGFGYASEDRLALKAALNQFPEALLLEAGLLIAPEDRDRESYARFRDRLMLPIEDARARVIAFGGRILDNSRKDTPKYLNSPETPLFDKGRTLYNLHRGGPAARRCDRLVIVEGYMDVVALVNAGIEECVAPLGTALTEWQIDRLWRIVPVPVLCFDGDAAGQRAAIRAITRALPLLRPGHSLTIARLPAGIDPDDLIKARGRVGAEALLDQAKSLIDALWEYERDAEPLTTPEAKAGLKQRLMDHVASITDRDIASLYRRELLDHYSTLAFPRRATQPISPVHQGPGARFTGPRPRFMPVPSRPLAETSARMRHGAGAQQNAARISAVITGLIAMPDEIGQHIEALARLAHLDPRLDALIALFDEVETLDKLKLSPILAQIDPLVAGRYSLVPPFRFLREAGSEARSELAEVIMLMVQRDALETALSEATSRFESNMDEPNRQEQSRLRDGLKALEKRELDLQARLGQMAPTQHAEATLVPDSFGKI